MAGRRALARVLFNRNFYRPHRLWVELSLHAGTKAIAGKFGKWLYREVVDWQEEDVFARQYIAFAAERKLDLLVRGGDEFVVGIFRGQEHVLFPLVTQVSERFLERLKIHHAFKVDARKFDRERDVVVVTVHALFLATGKDRHVRAGELVAVTLDVDAVGRRTHSTTIGAGYPAAKVSKRRKP